MGERLRSASEKAMLLFSAIALVTVILGLIHPPRVPEADEGSLAHIFQLSVAAMLPSGLVYLATANWKEPVRALRPLLLPVILLALAFVGLYLLEHRG